MNDVEKPSGVRNATILMALAGAFQLYSGCWSFQFSVMHPIYSLIIVGTIMVVSGFLSLFVSLAIWMQKSWAAKAVACIGIAVCVSLPFLGYYLIFFFFALWYWAIIEYIRAGRVAQPLDRDDI